ncbi:BatD family protein [Flavobacterium sp. Fl-77]|uniref:BatD family protein n=1 Tax=Flavobacterium flavipigmentatum TaxID=2893884 RepID=A0AAJ2VWN3_9FLAO|nr:MULTISPECIES: BatD family protein [unclassified Flavobacterium]MDX6180734.1 BatD family protein [Flavobacterium sp. Fl-33]MDX6184334.1 BatD family protein [Flavobacterium sp. Fl-77]UFH39444.1 BatD family protein [Flavobacterium sp. F-70]
MKRYLILLLFTFQGLMAQVQFEARVSKNTLGVNERFRIDFMMNVDGDNFEQPTFEGFRVVAGPSQQISQSWVNGRSSFQKIYSYILQPTQKGNFVVKQASIEYNGQVYKTAPVKIKVTNAVAPENDPENRQQQQGGPEATINLVAEISKTTPYLNEPITVVYKLYFNNINVTGFKELGKPKYNDFWNQNIEIKQLQVEEGSFKGERCYFVVLKKTILYPQKSGRLTIEPLSLDIGVQYPSNRRDMFGQMILTDGNKIVSAGAKTISVKALPETGKPAGFTGAVGKFDFKVTPSKTTLKNGESLDLIVSASGTGNTKLFTLPKPVVPNALEMYDPVHDEKVTTSLAGMSGKISDKYTIVPQYKGKYAIKPMEFSYFDLNSGTYKKITSPEIMVDVLDGPVLAEANQTSKNISTAVEQFKYTRPKTVLVSMSKNDFYGSKMYYTLLFLPFIIIPIIIIAKKRKEAIDNDITGKRIKMNNKLAKKYLSEAKKHLNNKEPFYIALEKAMHNFLKAKLHIETSEMSKDNIQELLLSRNANPEAVQSFITLTENCEFARYAPASSASIQQDYEKAILIISELEKQIV